MGPTYFETLLKVVIKGQLSATAVNKNDVKHSIVRARDAVVMVLEWEVERVRWGLA